MLHRLEYSWPDRQVIHRKVIINGTGAWLADRVYGWRQGQADGGAGDGEEGDRFLVPLRQVKLAGVGEGARLR